MIFRGTFLSVKYIAAIAPKKFLKIKCPFFNEIFIFGWAKKNWEANSEVLLLVGLCKLVISVCAKFEGYAAKTPRGVEFFSTIANFRRTVASYGQIWPTRDQGVYDTILKV